MELLIGDGSHLHDANNQNCLLHSHGNGHMFVYQTVIIPKILCRSGLGLPGDVQDPHDIPNHVVQNKARRNLFDISI